MITHRCIIAGGRNFTDYKRLASAMDAIFINLINDPNCEIQIVCGMAAGADSLGRQYAIAHKYQVNEFPADWNRHGRSAGYLRNKQMAESADACVCFWDGQSRGTAHMIQLAKQYNLQLRVIHY